MMREKHLEEVVRPPITAAEAKKLLKHMKTWDGKVSNQWKARANAHQQKMEEGDPYSYAEIYKGLRVRQEEDKLSAADRTHLKQSELFLAQELANALGKSEDEALKQMMKATQA